MKKCLAALTASVMALGSLSALGVQAEEVTLPGDVDGDGYITGHDSALLCRSLWEDDFSLTEEELSRADATGDGLVDRNDLDWIRENEEYQIGDVDLDGSFNLSDVATVLFLMLRQNDKPLSTLQYHLADYMPDGELHSDDLYALLMKDSLIAIDMMDDSLEHHVETGTYYSFDYKRGDFDGDGLVTYHDVALMQGSKNRDEHGIGGGRDDSLFLRDTNWDGYIDEEDFSYIKTMIEYDEPFGHCDEKSVGETFQSSYDALMASSYESAKMLEIIDQSEANALKQNGQIYIWDNSRQKYVVGLTDYKLYDVTLDGVVDINDATLLLEGSNRLALKDSFFVPEGCYEYRLGEDTYDQFDMIEFPY